MSNIDSAAGADSSGLSRRRFLSVAWLSSLGVLAAGLWAAGVKYLMPTIKEGEFGGKFNLGLLSQLPPAGDAPLNHAKGRFWLVRGDNDLVALYKACTHLDCLFNWNPQEKQFICPCHGSKFSMQGQVLNGPAPRDLDRFVVQLIGPKGELLAETSPDPKSTLHLATAPADSKAKGGDSAPTDSSSQHAAWQLITGASAIDLPPQTTVWVDTGRKIEGGKALFL